MGDARDNIEACNALINQLYDSALQPEQALKLLDALFSLSESSVWPSDLMLHVRRAASMHDVIERGEHLARQWLDRMPFHVWIVDEQCCLKACNSPAAESLERGDVFFLRGDILELSVCWRQNSKRLRGMIARALASDSEAGVLDMGSVDGEQLKLIVRGAPLPVLPTPGSGSICIMAIPASLSRQQLCKRLEEKYGLSPAESRLAVAFVNCPSLAQLAKDLHRSVHTVRSQIKAVFQKTNTCNQAELVQFLMNEQTAPAMLELAKKPDVNYCPMPGAPPLAWCEYGSPSGEPVMFFHSVTASRKEAAFHQDVLRAMNVRLISPDRPGYGQSPPDEGDVFHSWPDKVACLADHLEIERFRIVAMSGGTAHALACAVQMGDRVRSLTLISPMGEVHRVSDVRGMMPLNARVFRLMLRCPDALTDFMASVMARVFTTDPEAYLRQVTPHIAESDRRIIEDVAIRAHIKRAFVESRCRYLHAFSREMIRYARPWDIDLARVRVPVSLWHGKESRHIPFRLASRLARDLPSCQAHFLPDCGYYLNYSHWEEIFRETLSL